MPEIVHESLRSQTVIIGSYEVSYDENGVATVPVDLYELVCKGELKKVSPLNKQEAEPEVEAAPQEAAASEAKKHKLVLKKKK